MRHKQKEAWLLMTVYLEVDKNQTAGNKEHEQYWVACHK